MYRYYKKNVILLSSIEYTSGDEKRIINIMKRNARKKH